jgi:CRISPR-associated endonuclease Cas2
MTTERTELATDWADGWTPLRIDAEGPLVRLPWVAPRRAERPGPLDYILAYDIASDRPGLRRARRIRRMLAPVARRVQRSVYEASLDERELARLLVRIERELDPDRDRFRCYRHCARCASSSRAIPTEGEHLRPCSRQKWIA